MNLRLSIIAAAAVFAVAGCTAEPGPATAPTKTYADPVEWANAYCAGTLKANTAVAELMPQNQADPAGVKAGLIKAYTVSAAAAAESVQKLEKLGPPGPDVEDAHKSMVQLVRESGEYASKLVAGLRELEPNADFQANVAKLVARLFDQSSVQRSQDAIQKFSADPKYINALHNAPTCVEMRAKVMVGAPR